MGDFGFAEVEIRDGFIVSAREATGSEWEADRPRPGWGYPRLLTHLVVLALAAVPLSISVASAGPTILDNRARIGVAPDASVAVMPPQSFTSTDTVAVAPDHVPIHYQSQKGDTWPGIAAKFHVTVDELAWSNPDSGPQLPAGTVLHVPPVPGLVVKAGASDTVDGLGKAFQVPPTTIASFNSLPNVGSLSTGSELVIPGGLPPASVAVPASSVLALGCPVRQPLLSQPFGPSSLLFEPSFGGFRHFHEGLDLSGPYGTPVLASAAGIVTAAGPTSGGFGVMTEVVDALGRKELYGHLERVSVAKRDIVGTGDQLGLMGSTGMSTGPHVHLALEVDGKPVDPAPLLHC
jgi:murein DD-endopeptidase MepM/ murein hydrolase activator NlpD